MTLFSLYKAYASHPEAHWIMKSENARKLYDFVRNNEIKNILDLGTGIGASSAIVALALQDKKREGRVVTVEQDEKCFKIAKDLLPEDLKSMVEFHLSNPVVDTIEEIPCMYFSHFKELPPPPEGGWDLIITDGPGEFMLDGRFVNPPNCDALLMHMRNEIRPGAFLFFDGRMLAFSIVERYFSGDFYLLNEPNKRCNIIERKKTPVTFKDTRLEMFKEVGYLK